jgi:predicted nicotinamide N-methyase
MYSAFREFLRDHTDIAAPGLCPEIRLHLARDWEALWDALEQHLCVMSAPPFWSVAWPGGQALARYMLDHPDQFRGSTVLDLGAGSGLCAIAAAMTCAGSVHASEMDSIARAVIAINAEANEVAFTVSSSRLMSQSRWDVIVAGDLWYERFTAADVTAWLQAQAGAGAHVLLGDCGRAYFPRALARAVCRYRIPTSPSLEQGDSVEAAVWILRASSHDDNARGLQCMHG